MRKYLNVFAFVFSSKQNHIGTT